jgi:hypothetical protein
MRREEVRIFDGVGYNFEIENADEKIRFKTAEHLLIISKVLTAMAAMRAFLATFVDSGHSLACH